MQATTCRHPDSLETLQKLVTRGHSSSVNKWLVPRPLQACALLTGTGCCNHTINQAYGQCPPSPVALHRTSKPCCSTNTLTMIQMIQYQQWDLEPPTTMFAMTRSGEAAPSGKGALAQQPVPAHGKQQAVQEQAPQLKKQKQQQHNLESHVFGNVSSHIVFTGSCIFCVLLAITTTLRCPHLLPFPL